MCAIVGSFDKDKLIELIELNSYRGSHSYSFSLFDYYLNRLTIVQRQLGMIDYSLIDIPSRCYGIVHVQSPTTETTDRSSIHPALANLIDTYTVNKNNTHYTYEHALWHNGIIKADYCKILQERHGLIKWDTNLMLSELLTDGWYSLSKINGSFSCLYYAMGGMYLFRNEISPMFIDKDMNISSTKFAGAVTTQANKVLKLELQNRTYAPIFTFETVENPYYFLGEN